MHESYLEVFLYECLQNGISRQTEIFPLRNNRTANQLAIHNKPSPKLVTGALEAQLWVWRM